MGCNSPKTASQKSDFQTTDQSEIFFQNVRAIYYHRKIVPEAKVHIYTLKENPKNSEYSLSLIHNWKADQAYLMLNHISMDLPFTFLIGLDQSYDTLMYTGESMNENTNICLQIGASIQNNDSVYMINAEQRKFPFFENVLSKNAFLAVYKDFLRLVE